MSYATITNIRTLFLEAFVACLLVSSSLAFAPSLSFVSDATRSSYAKCYMVTLPTAEESAKALSEYMAKAHEDKLRAVKEAEAKSKERIEVSLRDHCISFVLRNRRHSDFCSTK